MKRLLPFLFLVVIIINCSNNDDIHEPEEAASIQNESVDYFELYSQGLRSKVFEGELEDYIVGSVLDVKRHNEKIYLIDGAGTEVLVLSEQGNLLQQIGRSGRGPGEYVRPVSLDVSDDGLVLLDQNLGRVTRYVYNEESMDFEPETSGSHNMQMSDLCVSDDGNVWVYGVRGEDIIHQLDNDLRSAQYSIGGGYDISDRATLEISKNGVLTCRGENIYTGFRADNKIRIYKKNDGSLYRQIEFHEIVPIEIVVASYDGVVGFAHKGYQGEAYDENGNYHDSLRNLIVINDYLLVQYERFFSDAESDRQHFVSLSIDFHNYTYAMTMDLPLIFDHENGKLFISGGNYPIPYVEINRVDK